MSNELQDWEIWLLAAIVLSQSGYIVRLRRKVRTLENGHLKAVAVHADREDPPESGRRLRRVKVWFGLAAIAGLARWIARSGAHPVASAVALVSVAVAGTAIVLLPETREMEPQAASPPIPATRTPSQRPAARGPTEPPATSGTPTPTETTSTPPASTTGAPTTTAAPTTARPSSTSARASVSGTAPLDATVAAPTTTVAATTTAPVPVDATPLDAGKPDKGGKPKPDKAPAMAPANEGTPPPLHLGLCVQLLGVIRLGDRGTD